MSFGKTYYGSAVVDGKFDEKNAQLFTDNGWMKKYYLVNVRIPPRSCPELEDMVKFRFRKLTWRNKQLNDADWCPSCLTDILRM